MKYIFKCTLTGFECEEEFEFEDNTSKGVIKRTFNNWVKLYALTTEQFSCYRKNNIMTHKGYSSTIQYNDEKQVFFGKIDNTPEPVSFQADNVTDLKKAFEKAVDKHIKICSKIKNTGGKV